MRHSKPAVKPSELPDGIIPSDLDGTSEELDYEFGEYGSITMHRTERFGWVIATLPISKGKRGSPDRTYGIPVNGSAELVSVSVGNGPHVTKTIWIRAKKSRAEALKPFHDLYVKGLQVANGTRDRISSRRAQGQRMRDQGQRMRDQGHLSWRWDT